MVRSHELRGPTGLTRWEKRDCESDRHFPETGLLPLGWRSRCLCVRGRQRSQCKDRSHARGPGRADQTGRFHFLRSKMKRDGVCTALDRPGAPKGGPQHPPPHPGHKHSPRADLIFHPHFHVTNQFIKFSSFSLRHLKRKQNFTKEMFPHCLTRIAEVPNRAHDREKKLLQ